MKTILIGSFLLFLGMQIIAQNQNFDSIPWHHHNPQTSEWQGINLEEAYQYLESKNRVPKTVIVAIIDSGVDTLHEDLKERLWRNPNEIPYNKIDDDGNGYIDDIYGWNFIGGKNGRNIDGETLEFVRLYRDKRDAFEGKSISEIPKDQKEEYKLWLEYRNRVYKKRKEYKTHTKNLKEWANTLTQAEKVLKESYKLDSLDIELVKNITPKNKAEAVACDVIIFSDSVGITAADLEEEINYYISNLEKKYNPNYDPRPLIVKDNPDDILDTIYGNNDVMASSSSHGTGVSGVVAAVRNNQIGTQGIADSVLLITLRVVPGGDERDKDVALAIRYAVNNGAKIINCSFGKDYSKHPDFVKEAIDYAVKHDVLIIHAAGNNGENNDKIKHFPIPTEAQRTHWIDVGASGEYSNNRMAAAFSNYGKETVDVFAPGVDIYTTSPNSNYRASSGTSNASPVVAGVAALLKSHYPELSGEEIRLIILKSVSRYPKAKVTMPGSSKKVKFSKLSASGGIINAYQAVMMAEEYVSGEK